MDEGNDVKRKKLAKAFEMEMFEAGWILKYDEQEQVKGFYKNGATVTREMHLLLPTYVCGQTMIELFYSEEGLPGFTTHKLDDRDKNYKAEFEMAMRAAGALERVSNNG